MRCFLWFFSLSLLLLSLGPLLTRSECKSNSSPYLPVMTSYLGKGIDATQWSILDAESYNASVGRLIVDVTYTGQKCVYNMYQKTENQICDQCEPRSVTFGSGNAPVHVSQIVENQFQMHDFLSATTSRDIGTPFIDKKAIRGSFQRSKARKAISKTIFSSNSSFFYGYQTFATFQASLPLCILVNNCLNLNWGFERDLERVPTNDVNTIENFRLWSLLFSSYGTDVIMEFMGGCSFGVYSTSNSQYHQLAQKFHNIDYFSDANLHLDFIHGLSTGNCLGEDFSSHAFKENVVDQIKCVGSSGSCLSSSGFRSWRAGCSNQPTVLSVKIVSTCHFIQDSSRALSCQEARNLYFEIAFMNELLDRVLRCTTVLHHWQNVPDIVPSGACSDCRAQGFECECPPNPAISLISWIKSLQRNAASLRKQARRIQTEIENANLTKTDDTLLGFNVSGEMMESWDFQISQIETILNSPQVDIMCKCSHGACPSNCCNTSSVEGWVHPDSPVPSGLIDAVNPSTTPWLFDSRICTYKNDGQEGF